MLGRVINRIPPQYRAAVIALGCLTTFLAFMFVRERRRFARVERQAKIDSLTRLPNRQAFELRLAQEWMRAGRYGRPLGLLLLDLDDFKQINDTKGHAAGDAVLREVAAAVSTRIRVTDMAARLGGDEFVVICPETTVAGLESLAKSLEHRLREESIGASVGFSEREDTDGAPSDMVARADAAMYRRKQGARGHPDRPLPAFEPTPSLAAK